MKNDDYARPKNENKSLECTDVKGMDVFPPPPPPPPLHVNSFRILLNFCKRL